MSDTLYGLDVLRLAAAVGDYPLLADPDARVDRRSAICGSEVTVDVVMGANGRVSAVGVRARACALGQAAATLLARGINGRTAQDVGRAASDWAAWLEGDGASLPDWPGIDALANGRRYPARYASLRLAFDAAATAAAEASVERRRR